MLAGAPPGRHPGERLMSSRRPTAMRALLRRSIAPGTGDRPALVAHHYTAHPVWRSPLPARICSRPGPITASPFRAGDTFLTPYRPILARLDCHPGLSVRRPGGSARRYQGFSHSAIATTAAHTCGQAVYLCSGMPGVNASICRCEGGSTQSASCLTGACAQARGYHCPCGCDWRPGNDCDVSRSLHQGSAAS